MNDLTPAVPAGVFGVSAGHTGLVGGAALAADSDGACPGVAALQEDGGADLAQAGEVLRAGTTAEFVTEASPAATAVADNVDTTAPSLHAGSDVLGSSSSLAHDAPPDVAAEPAVAVAEAEATSTEAPQLSPAPKPDQGVVAGVSDAELPAASSLAAANEVRGSGGWRALFLQTLPCVCSPGLTQPWFAPDMGQRWPTILGMHARRRTRIHVRAWLHRTPHHHPASSQADARLVVAAAAVLDEPLPLLPTGGAISSIDGNDDGSLDRPLAVAADSTWPAANAAAEWASLEVSRSPPPQQCEDSGGWP